MARFHPTYCGKGTVLSADKRLEKHSALKGLSHEIDFKNIDEN